MSGPAPQPLDENPNGPLNGPPDGAPPLPEDATNEEKERHWYTHVYQGDRMPQLTFRAVAMGALLGMLMSVSNLYTTLKVGWAFGVAVTACVLSYVIWNALRLASARRLGQMSILENTCMASTASAAGYSTGSTLATMFGALLILQAPDDKTSTASLQPWWIVAAFTLCTAALGVFLAIPMKRQMINREQLPFPTGIAAATTLRSLYSHGREAMAKATALIVGIISGAAIGVMNTGRETLVPTTTTPSAIAKAMTWIDAHLFGVLPELLPHHGFTQVSQAGRLVNAVAKDHTLDKSIGLKLPAFGFEPSALLVAAGMIVGLRVSLSMVFGTCLLYFFVGPWIISQDNPALAPGDALRAVKITGGGQFFQVVHWALWGGTAVMVFSSLTAVALQWRTIARSFSVLRGGARDGAAAAHDARVAAIEVPTGWLIAGLIPITIAMLAVQYLAFKINPLLGLVAVAMSFVLSLVASRATGETDTTPIGAMGKVMQLLFAVLSPQNVQHNLAAAGVAANSAIGSADLLTDLKSGYLLGANPRRQFIAQFIGVFFGTLAIVPAWYLMVPNKEALEKYPLPATQQWVAVARVLTEGIENLPMSARWAILIGAFVGVVMPIIERFLPRGAKKYMPSAMGLGLSWVMPFANAFAFGVGAVITWMWTLIARKNADRYNIPLASGLIAGESLLKALIAMAATGTGLLWMEQAAK